MRIFARCALVFVSVHDAAMDVAGNTSTTPKTGRVYPALDGLRTVAFTLVFLMHYLRLPFGWSGVNVFFVLSGFLITGILLDTKDDQFRVHNFYVRRTLRIFPLYYGVWAVILLLHPLLHWRWSVYWLAWPLYLGNFLRFFSHQAAVFDTPLEHAADGWLVVGRYPRAGIYLGPFWSLCVEEQFYLVWPWLVFWANQKLVKRICAVTVIALPLIRVLLQWRLPEWLIHQELLYRFTPLQLDSLLGGALLAIVFREGTWQPLVRFARFATPTMAAIAIMYVCLHLRSFHPWAFRTYGYPWWKFSLGLTYINVFAASLIVNCVSGEGISYRILNATVLRSIGRITYGAYVFHDLFHDVYVKDAAILARHLSLSDEGSTLLTALIAYPATLGIAWLSYRFLETPFLNLKNRFTKRNAFTIS